MFRRKEPVTALLPEQIKAQSMAQVLAEKNKLTIEREREKARIQIDVLREKAAQEKEQRREQERNAKRVKRESDKRNRSAKRAQVSEILRERVMRMAGLLVVNATAVFGQYLYGLESVTDHSWPMWVRAIIAGLYALAIESVSLTVQWHAHDAFIQGATGRAVVLRRYAYGIAAIVALINYSHFTNDNAELFGVTVPGPTPAAVTFGLLSFLSPFLWSLHTLREKHAQLVQNNIADVAGAVFSAERARRFPIRTYRARGWSIDHNVNDPYKAWQGYNVERTVQKRMRDNARRQAIANGGRVRNAWNALRGKTVFTVPDYVPEEIDDIDATVIPQSPPPVNLAAINKSTAVWFAFQALGNDAIVADVLSWLEKRDVKVSARTAYNVRNKILEATAGKGNGNGSDNDSAN